MKRKLLTPRTCYYPQDTTRDTCNGKYEQEKPSPVSSDPMADHQDEGEEKHEGIDDKDADGDIPTAVKGGHIDICAGGG